MRALDNPLRRVPPPRRAARRGAMLYSLVVANSLLIGVLALTALTVVRVERRASQRGLDLESAQMLAWSGVELGVRELARNTDWRTAYVHNVETAATTFGGGRLSWRYLDPTDADLADDPLETVEVQGVGRYGDAVWVHSLRFPFRRVSPLDYALHCGGKITLNGGDQISAVGAALSTNDVFELKGTLIGSAECASRTGNGVATGSITTHAPAKGLPAAGVFASYAAQATVLPYVGDMSADVLAPGVNTYAGGVNANGVYYIDTGSWELTISGTRISGTLVVRGNCRVDAQALLQPVSGDFPVLIVSGNLRVTTSSQTQALDENAWSCNFNPDGAPYSGVADADTADAYPNEIQGLVHVKGSLTLDKTARIRGIVLCEGDATITGNNNEIDYDAAIAAAPPAGYNITNYVLVPHARSAHRTTAP